MELFILIGAFVVYCFNACQLEMLSRPPGRMINIFNFISIKLITRFKLMKEYINVSGSLEIRHVAVRLLSSIRNAACDDHVVNCA